MALARLDFTYLAHDCQLGAVLIQLRVQPGIFYMQYHIDMVTHDTVVDKTVVKAPVSPRSCVHFKES